jgi:quercetin dioxygenase-like cupin family protein
MDYTLIDSLADMVDEVPADSIVSRTLYDGDDARVILFAFAPGQELSEHTAARPAVLHFLSGTADLVLGADEHQARPGTWVHMKPNMPHSIRAHTEVRMLLILL